MPTNLTLGSKIKNKTKVIEFNKKRIVYERHGKRYTFDNLFFEGIYSSVKCDRSPGDGVVSTEVSGVLHITAANFIEETICVKKMCLNMDNTEINELIKMGYHRVSRKFGTLSRIDREDWKKWMAQEHAPWDSEGEGMNWVKCLGDKGAANHYRRCYSKDKVNVDPKIITKFPLS